jgi:8-oxo-dGTP pyrophosphatase MutT (NUDIX family)
MFTEIKKGLRHPNQKDRVFAAIYSGNLALMVMRQDGFIGWAGGRIEPGEELLEGLYRETIEEIGFNLLAGTTKIVRLCSHARHNGDTQEVCGHIHAYACEVIPAVFRQIMKNYVIAPHFLIETYGVIAVQLDKLEDFTKHNFKNSALIELEALVKFVQSK